MKHDQFLTEMIRSELAEIVGQRYVSVGESDKLVYSTDWAWMPQMWLDRGQSLRPPDYIVHPGSAEEISEIMDIAKLHLHYRSSKYKGQTYRSYSLARAYRRDGKNRKEIVLKLGKLSHEEIERWRMALRAAKEPGAVVTTLEDIAVRRHYAYLDVAVANALWDEWALDGVFAKKGRRELTVASVARILALNRCIDPATKSQATQWFDKTALPYLLEVEPERFNPSRVFRELAVIEEHKEALCKHLVVQSILTYALYYRLSGVYVCSAV